MEVTEKLNDIPSLKAFIQKNQVKCENGKVYIEVDEDLIPYWLNKNKSEIVDAVNQHDEKTVKSCNAIFKKIKPSMGSLFAYTGEDGEKYYNEKYGNGKN